MGDNTCPTKKTGRSVDWISNVPIRTCRDKPAGRGICGGMEASTSKGKACPDHQGDCAYLKSNRDRLKRKKAADRVQANHSCDHDEDARKGYHFQHNVRRVRSRSDSDGSFTRYAGLSLYDFASAVVSAPRMKQSSG